MNRIQRILTPEAFQGTGKKPPYFEGWYYKIELPDGRVFAFIPGLSLSGGDPHAFLQLVGCGTPAYLRYPLHHSRFDPDRLFALVGNSVFEADRFRVRTETAEADVQLIHPVPFSSRRWHTGIMGPLAFAPFLECRHGVVVLTSRVCGVLRTSEGTFSLDGGKCYIEKDWGSRFPDPYLWIHAFVGDGSFMLSAARIPVFGTSFPGMAAFLYDGKRTRVFTSYNGARILSAEQKPDGSVTLSARVRGGSLRLNLSSGRNAVLRAPTDSGMQREIRESCSASLDLVLSENSGEILFQQSAPASFECTKNGLLF